MLAGAEEVEVRVVLAERVDAAPDDVKIHSGTLPGAARTRRSPVPSRDRLDRRTPLDVIDGAARVYDPIVRGEAGDPVHGVFLKDYMEAPW
ncbi:hypothetical protein GCM10018952_56630 [Streptosporangium vulgare]